jgi:hypothetical protein
MGTFDGKRLLIHRLYVPHSFDVFFGELTFFSSFDCGAIQTAIFGLAAISDITPTRQAERAA